ncbi:MAG: hypothetical protein KIS92_13995 [Planctomycetota bacterium]|nr:hypothetical protein [Planctomycetota bacterium]
MSDDLPSADEEPPPQGPHLEPLPSFEAVGWRVIGALTLAGTGGMLWLAVREDSSPDTRRILDGMASLFIGGLMALAAYRVLINFAFRILDLIAIVMTLSLGLKATIDSMAVLGARGLIWEGRVTDGDKFGSVLLACLITASILMAGAALGLRYCARIKLDRPMHRIAAVISGMLAFPAVIGVPVFVIACIQDVAALMNPRKRLEADLTHFLLLLACFAVLAANTLYFLRSIAITGEVAPPADKEGA